MLRIIFSLVFFPFASAFTQVQNNSLNTELHQYLDSFFKPNQPGGAVVVARPGEKPIFMQGYGVADLRTRTPVNSKTNFNLGSISKTFVAFAILKLQEQGKLSVEDPLEKYFPDFKNKELAKQIKIKHLLSHTSGLPDNRRVAADSVFFLTAKDEENFAPVKQNDTLHFEPGEKFEYSNPAFNGLALIVEKVSGMKWQQFIKEMIFLPAGMKTSVITDGNFPQTGVAHGYRKIGDRFVEYDFGEFPTFAASGNGGVWSSVEELLKYEEAIQKNLFLSRELIELSRTVYKPEKWKSVNTPKIGFSWFINQSPGDMKVIGHTGDQGGFRADYSYLPQHDLLVVVLCNGSQNASIISRRILALCNKHKLL